MTQVQKRKCHIKSRKSPYGNTQQKRLELNDEQVPWSYTYKDYNPPLFDPLVPSKYKVKVPPDEGVSGIEGKKFKFNKLDTNIDRKSHMGEYKIENGFPLNPMGRTGLRGRGILWRWGPNHAADPVVTRWLRDNNNNIIKNKKTNKNYLEFVAIKRNDGGGWAIPGGMVEPGDTVSRTLQKEFSEEAMNSLEMNENEKKKTFEQIQKLFKNGKEVYKGYVDDPRNTDNSWMETVVYNFHDPQGTSVGALKLEAGDDAGQVQWMKIDDTIQLYASHKDFIYSVTQLLGAHWSENSNL